MGSTQPPDGNTPFGYGGYVDPDFLFFQAPTPPTGEPVLSNDDYRRLDSFFEDMSSNDYHPVSYGEGLNFSDQWINELPPAYLGHSTSFGQQPAHNSASSMHGMSPYVPDMFSFGPAAMPPPPLPAPPPPHLPVQNIPYHPHHQHQHQHHPQHRHPAPHTPIEQNAHDDVAALLTTLQNGHQTNHPPRTNGINRGTQLVTRPSGRVSDRTRLPQHQPQLNIESVEEVRPIVNAVRESARGPTRQRLIRTPALQWGSDATFGGAQGFVPPDDESSDALERRRVDAVKGFAIGHTASRDQPNSPVRNGGGSFNSAHGVLEAEGDTEAPPRKRRKSKAVREEVAEDGGNRPPSVPPKSVARKRKSKVDLVNGAAGESSTAASQENNNTTTSAKRRKSTAAAAAAAAAAASKAPRENLTDAQKRENHIKSEQRRRGAIKEGFEDLTEMVPNVKGGGYSKSVVLGMTAEFLEAIMRGNEEVSRGT